MPVSVAFPLFIALYTVAVESIAAIIKKEKKIENRVRFIVFPPFYVSFAVFSQIGERYQSRHRCILNTIL